MLDLGGSDAVAGRRDHVVLATDVPEIAVLILHAEIAGQQKFSSVFFHRGFRIFPVLDHGARTRLAHADDAAASRRQLLAALVDDTDAESRRSLAHRAGPNRKQF